MTEYNIPPPAGRGTLFFFIAFLATTGRGSLFSLIQPELALDGKRIEVLCFFRFRREAKIG